MGEQDEEWNGEERRKRNKWHVGKEIPLALMLTLVLQTGGGIWWAASLTSKIDYAIQRLEEFRAERYTREDARRDFAVVVQRDIEHERRLAEVETMIRSLRIGR